MLIDVEALRSPRRGSLQISFRRTDQDRKPARPFIRPNDYALSVEKREAESARRIEAINAKRQEAQRIYVERLDAPKTYLRACDKINSETVRKHGLKTEAAALRAINGGAKTFSELATAGVCSIGNARRVLRRLDAKGLVKMEIVAASKSVIGGKQYFMTITPAGLEAVLSGGDA